MNERGAQEPMPDNEQAASATPEAPMTPSTAAGPVSPGARLAAGREEHGWTVEQVASHLKLAPRQIAALERDDYAALPGMPIVRGFVRSYAKLLKIDAAPLLAQLGGETVLASEPLKPKEGLATPFMEARLPSMSERPAISSKWMIGLLLIVLVAAGLWAAQLGGGFFASVPQQASDVTQPDQDEASEEGTQEASQTVAEPVVETGEPGVVSDSRAPAEAGTAPPTVQQPAATPGSAAPAADAPPTSVAGPTTAPQPAAPTTPVTEPSAPASGANTLNIVVREESWVEVRAASGGSTVLARLAQPGENIFVEITEPVVLVVGNAAGVEVSLRGKPLQLKGSTTSNVARLSLK